MMETLAQSANPLDSIYTMFKNLLLLNPYMQVKYGCPANNFMQELAPVNSSFNAALLKLVEEWHSGLENAIKAAKAKGLVRKNVNPKQVAYFVMSGYGGIRNLGKVYNNTNCYKAYLKELKNYLHSLQ